MKRVFILGAGGFGREVFAWLHDLPGMNGEWDFSGFIDDDPNALEGFDYPKGVVGDFGSFRPESGDLFVCGLGQPGQKARLCQHLLDRGADFLTLVHPSVVIGRNVKLGRGVVLCPGVILTCDIEVGDFAMLNCHSSAGHDVVIEPWVTVSGHCDLTSRTLIGSKAFLGSSVRVLPGMAIGAEAFVGAGSVVIRSVRPGAKVFGNPARPL